MKSLRAFKRIKDMYKYFVKKSRDLEPKLMICEKEDFNLVEKELKELTEYKKVFEKLNLDISDAVDLENWIKLAQFHYENKNKKLKALEIIKEKRVNVNWLFVSFENYQQYKQALENGWSISIQVSSTPLTKEEYDLLKEVLL